MCGFPLRAWGGSAFGLGDDADHSCDARKFYGLQCTRCAQSLVASLSACDLLGAHLVQPRVCVGSGFLRGGGWQDDPKLWSGTALLCTGPAFFSPGWLRNDLLFQGDLWMLYNTFYSMGWCFLLVGMFRWPAMRHILLRSQLGITALVISLIWYVAGSLRHEFAPYSIGWSLAAILSLFVALCGILSPKRSERSFAACGLVLMSVYSYYGSKFGGAAWFQIGLLADPRVMAPFLLTGLLAWTALPLQATGLSRKLGIEYGE